MILVLASAVRTDPRELGARSGKLCIPIGEYPHAPLALYLCPSSLICYLDCNLGSLTVILILVFPIICTQYNRQVPQTLLRKRTKLTAKHRQKNNIL